MDGIKLELKLKPKKPIIIEGFPGFGLVGMIATEYLIEHLKTKRIGKIWFEDIPPIAIIHKNKIVQPLELHYSKEHNLIILQGLEGIAGSEWKLAELLTNLCKTLNCKELISLEGIGSPTPSKIPGTFFYSNNQKGQKQLNSLSTELKEGIIIGITGALLLKIEKQIPYTCIFSETYSSLPDSKAAARVIEILSKYLNLNIDSKPLIKQAEKFEQKLKSFIDKSREIKREKEKKDVSYIR